MKLAIPFFGVFALLAAATPPALAANSAEEYIRDRYIVVLKRDVSKRDVRGIAEQAAGRRNVGHVYTHTIKGFSARLSPAALDNLTRNPNVASIEHDNLIYAYKPGNGKGPGGGGDGGGETSSETTPWGITRVGGHCANESTTPYAPPAGTAWIIDTGVDLDHPDLNVDSSRGSNFVYWGKTRGDVALGDDGNGHGTHVAGTIAAIGGNGLGVVGVAAGAKLVPVRVLDNNGSGSTSGVIAGVEHVATNANTGDVANMSLGGSISTALDDAVVALAGSGVLVTLAAGNESDDADNHSPARANHTNIYTVSAFEQGDKWAYFSNYGNPPVDVAAPGRSIESTYKRGGYATLSGTSMAAPHVAGILLCGALKTDGSVSGDPDGNADPIAHR